MKRKPLYVVAAAAGLAVVLLIGVSFRGPQTSSRDARLITDAAFRDGLFQAKLDVQNGRKPHFTSGRWGSNADRALYIAGYQQGYREFAERHPGKAIEPDAAEVAGFWDGMLDGAGNRLASLPFQVDRSDKYRNAGQALLQASTDPEKYKQYYRRGYSNGYQQGYYSSGPEELKTLGESTSHF